MDRLLSVREVAELLGLKESTIYAWTSEAKIPHFKLGNRVKFSEKKVEAWLGRKEIKGRRRNSVLTAPLQ